MRRRAVGLLLATGGLALGAAVPSAEEAGLRSFASRGLGAVLQANPEEAPGGLVRAVPSAASSVQLSQAPAPSPATGVPTAPAVQSSQRSSPQPAASQAATPQAPTPQAATPQPTGAWPKTLPEAKAEAEAKANPQLAQQSWPQSEIDLARARCTVLLKGLDAVAIPEPSMRDGDCGAPAPVRLVSIGRNPEVALSPPPLVTCDMVVSLHTWMKSDVQPLARKHLGAPVIKIETMSDYSCRNAYGRTKSRLSEHGRANAVDIRGFVTAKGEATMLLADWGMTARDIAQQVAAAKAEAQRVAREKAAAEAAALAARKVKGGEPSATTASPGGSGAGGAHPVQAGPAIGLRDGGATLTEGLPKVRITVPGAADEDDGGKPRSGLVFGIEPNRLGGPKAKTEPEGRAAVPPHAPTAAPPPIQAAAPANSATAKSAPGKIVHAPATARDQASAKARFLREAHASACRIFGTTLGPEANNAHRNHFHVDMAERTTTNFCE